MKRIKEKRELITSNTIVVPDGYAGWVAYNLGSDGVTINGVHLNGVTGIDPGEKKLDYHYMGENVVYDDNIEIVFDGIMSTERKVLLIRFKYQ